MIQKQNFITLLFILCIKIENSFSQIVGGEENKDTLTKSTINENFYVDKNGIFLVDDSNIDLFIKEFPFSLLLSTLHPCKLCRQVMPEIVKTINPLKNLNTPVYVGKLNITESQHTQMRLKLDSFIHLTYFSEGIPVTYDGGRTGEEIVQWVREKFDPLIGEIKSVREIEQLKKYSESLIVFFGDDEEKYNQFFLNARPKETILFVRCKLAECLQKYNLNSGDIRIFRRNDSREYVIKSDYYKKENLRKQMEEIIRGRVMKLDREVFDLIFGNRNSALFIYSPKSEQKKYVDMLDQVYDFAKENSLKLVNCDLSNGIEQKLQIMTGFKNSELPLVVIHHTTGDDLKTYVMDRERRISIENIKGFINDFKNNNLIQYVKSSEPPRSQKSHLLEIVGSTLETIVHSEKDVVVLFYLPFCGDCKIVYPIFSKVADKFKENLDFDFGTMNMYSNDQVLFSLKSYPTIAIWPAHQKDKPIITNKVFDNPNDILKFVKENSYSIFDYDEYKFEEQKDKEVNDEEYKLDENEGENREENNESIKKVENNSDL